MDVHKSLLVCVRSEQFRQFRRLASLHWLALFIPVSHFFPLE
jgi:hypothetical protein